MGIFNSGVFAPRYMRSAAQPQNPATPRPPRYNRPSPGILGSAPPPTPDPANQYAPDGHVLSQAEISDRARAQGAAAGTASSLAANTQVGLANQKAGAGAMATASSIASAPAAPPPAPNPDYYTLKDPGTLTPQGAAYRDQVMKRMQGVDPVVQNAQATADTQASRTNYRTRMGAEEAAAQARFMPGTLQYQRMMDSSLAGANSANQAGQSQVNQLARTRSDDVQALANGIEKDAYGNAIGERNFRVGREDVKYQREYQTGRDAVGDAHWDTTNTQNQNQLGIENSHWDTTNKQTQDELTYQHQQDAQSHQDALDAIKRGDIDGAINAVQGAKAKNYLLSVKASGGDVLAALNGMFENGTLKEDYRDATPAEDSLQSSIDFIKTVHPEWSDEQIQTAAIERLISLDKTKIQPVTDAEKAIALEEAAKRLASLPPGAAPDPKDLETLPSLNPEAIPMGSADAFKQWKASNNTGGWVKIGGQAYQLGHFQNKTGGDGGDFVTLTAPDGSVKYLLHDGSISDKAPGLINPGYGLTYGPRYMRGV